MRLRLQKLLILLVLSLLFVPMLAFSDTVEIDNITYTTSTDGTASVTSCTSGLTGDITIPSTITYDNNTYSVTSISNYAFMSSSLSTITILASVTETGMFAFAYSKSLTSVIFSDGLTKLGDYAFVYCSSLSSMDIPEGVTTLGHRTFSECTDLSSVTLHEGLTTISGSFYGCTNLSSITLPESLVSIIDYAFFNCSSLTTINIPESVETVGESVFSGCSSLSTIYSCNPQPPAAFRNAFLDVPTTICMLYVPIGSKEYYQVAQYWEDFSNIEEADITDKRVITIDDITYILSTDGTASVSEASADLTGDIIIPTSITDENNNTYSVISIAGYAFYGCNSINSVDIPQSVTAISVYAFYNCSTISSISIPDGVTSIGEGAFYGCGSLSNITIPEAITEYSTFLFLSCTSLSSITISENVTSVGYSSFHGCTGLSTIYSNNPTPPTAFTYTFYSVPKETCIVYVPIGSKELYQAATYWQDFTNIVEIDTTGITEVESESDVEVTVVYGTIKVTGAEAGADVAVYNMQGYKVTQTTIQADGIVSLPTMAKGVYIVVVAGNSYKVIM